MACLLLHTPLQLPQSSQSPSSAQVLNSRHRTPRIFAPRPMPKNASFSPLVTGPSAQVWLGPHSNLSLAYKPQASNHRRVPFLGEFYSFIDPIFTGVRGVRLCSMQRQLPCLPPNRPLPHHYVQIRGLLGSPSKPPGRSHGAMFGARAPEAVLGPLPLGIRPFGNTGVPTGCLGSAVPPP